MIVLMRQILGFTSSISGVLLRLLLASYIGGWVPESWLGIIHIISMSVYNTVSIFESFFHRLLSWAVTFMGLTQI
jgi:hypothetical protein